MRFAADRCPQCGSRPAYLLECALLDVPLVEDEPGSFDYSDRDPSEVCWDSEPEVDERGQITLYCQQKHAWQTMFVDDPSSEQAMRG